MPTVFENGLIRVTATYSPDQKNGISVVNRGVKKSSGKEKEANGRAKFASDTATGRLKVSFFGPFYSDYIIVELDTVNYAWSMVAGSSEDYLWILSRTPSIDGAVLKNLMQKAKSLGFNLSRLYMVPQE
jgi:apolipoprotein D and lipocalin family protein